MKELSIEEKAKRYDEAIDIANELRYVSDKDSLQCKTVEHIFPELKESDDKNVRKSLLNEFIYLQSMGYKFAGLEGEEIITWFEKQANKDEEISILKDQIESLHAAIKAIKETHRIEIEKKDKVMGISDTAKQKLKDDLDNALKQETQESWNKFLEKRGKQKPETIFLKFRIGDKVTNGEDTYTINFIGKDCYWVKEHDCATIPFEYQHHWKLVEQNHTDKVEPKFKVGDWIITNKNHIWYVDETPETTSYLYRLENQYGKVEVAEFEVVDKKAKLWTIQDAKNGDVLVGGEQFFLFKRMNTSDSFYAHCNYHFIGYDSLSIYDCSYSIDNIYPASKEQRDILFIKMKEAGYEWDGEKKELRKIEQNFANSAKTCKDEQTPVWSEEDEKLLKSIIINIENLQFSEDMREKYYHIQNTSKNYYQIMVDWLKSLKERVQPQQKQE